MLSLKKLAAAIITSSLVTSVVLASTTAPQSEYTVVLYNNCQMVRQLPMTSAQVDAYLALKSEEKVMDGLQQPVTAIEDQLEDYSQQIEALTDLAVQETDTSLYIDKNLMAQQQAVAAKLSALVAENQQHFDALGDQGQRIGDLADNFTQLLAASVDGVDYDQIDVRGPNQEANAFHCYADRLDM